VGEDTFRKFNFNNMEELIHLTDQSNLPLSSNQLGLWIIAQQDLSSPAYNMQMTYHFRGEIRLAVFRESLEILFERQHTMFSIFRQKEGIPFIEIKKRPVDIDLIDFSNFPQSVRREKILSFAGENIRRTFDLENGPLYRFYLLKEDESSYFFNAVIHHLIFDGFSRRIFVQELSRIYTDIVNGADYRTEPLQYFSYDYSLKEKGSLTPEKEQQFVNFWKDYLKDCPPELKFPYDFHRKSEPSGLGCRVPFRISEKNTEKLRQLSKELGATLFNTMLSAVGIIFQKYTGSDDICIGVPVSTRRDDLVQKLFGMFVNTVGVRLKIDGTKKFSDQVNLTRRSFMGAIARSELPFEKIVKAVNPERIPGVNPFYQISFTWHNGLTIPMNFAGISGESTTVENGISSFDFTFFMWENGNFIDGEIEYDVDIIKQDTALRLKDHFLSLVDNLVQNPEAPMSSVSIVSDEDKRMISLVNDTRTNYPGDKTIAELFEEQAKLYPEKTALVFKEKVFTYRELNERANQIAWKLRESGVNKDTPVGLITEKSAEMIVAILGILKSGSGYVPIDPEYPEERINYMIKDSGCRIILTNSDKSDKVNLAGVTILNLDSENTYHNDKSDPEILNSSTDLAYIIYTSGTTGTPKGTIIHQKGVVRLVRNTNYIDIKPDDHVLQSSAIVFDASVEEIYGALLNGATLYVIDKENLLDPGSLGDFLESHRITYVDLTSALFTQIAEARTDIFKNVKTLVLGGDVVSVVHANKIRKDNPSLKLINTYGPTENSCNSTYYIIDKDFESNIPIGKPISNSTAYIFDKDMNYLPVGVVGELYVGGDGVSPGYLNQEDLNRKAFLVNPHNPGERLYRTGDLARWLPDWNIDFRGRADNQLKIRGFRVELGEIESAINSIEGVIETVVKAIKVEEGDYKLIAFVNVPVIFSMEREEMIAKVKEKLPSYMVPSGFKYMHGFPTTINGKTDRKALVYDMGELLKREKTDLTKSSQTERTLIKIWGDVLKTSDLSLSDNFFDIGGNSLLAISLTNRISKEFNIVLKALKVFELPTIRDQAEFLSGRKDDSMVDKNLEIDDKTRNRKNVNFRKLRG
jgi:amino acid adenylation domain-containing protein